MFWDLGAAGEVSVSTGGKWLLEFIFEMGLKDEHVEFKNTRSITRTHFILGDVERTTGNTAITSITREILRRRLREKGTYLLSSVFTIHCMLWAVLIFMFGNKVHKYTPLSETKGPGTRREGWDPSQSNHTMGAASP